MPDKIKEKLLKEIESCRLEKIETINPNRDDDIEIFYFKAKTQLEQHEETKKAMTEEFLKKIDNNISILKNYDDFDGEIPKDEKELAEFLIKALEELKQSIQGE